MNSITPAQLETRLHRVERQNRVLLAILCATIGLAFLGATKGANVTATAFEVKHGSWDQAFGYKFQTADRVIVISGDTAPTDAIVKACDGCDVLLHEVYNARPLSDETQPTLRYFQAFHTTAQELGTIATAAHPKLLVLYHQIFEGLPEQDLLDQVKQAYKGNVASGRDLDVF